MAEERQRTERTEVERQQRRRRHDGSIDASQTLKLAIPQEVAERLKAEGKTPRWVNDVGGRIRDLTVRDDYEVVDGVEPVPVVIDRKSGETVKAILLAKPTEFITEDRQAADKRRRETEEGMLKGQIPGKDGAAASQVTGVAGASAYVDKNSSLQTNRILNE